MSETVIIGAGPAGLAAAYELSRAGRTCRVLEKDDIVGGISRTVRSWAPSKWRSSEVS